MEEQWCPVVGYENEYEVSDQGRVRSMARVFYQLSRWGSLYPYRKAGQLLKPGLTSVGYPSVSLCGKTHLVHRLVAAAFIGPCPARCEVRHKDGTRINNHVSNLEYGTRKENVADARRHKTLYKAHDRHRKIPLEDHDKIRAMYRNGVCQRDICEMYGVTVSPVHKILRCGLS